jgi:hypothetical protein
MEAVLKKKSEMIFESSKKSGHKNPDIDNYEIY